jgi:hypothetical protein
VKSILVIEALQNAFPCPVPVKEAAKPAVVKP